MIAADERDLLLNLLCFSNGQSELLNWLITAREAIIKNRTLLLSLNEVELENLPQDSGEWIFQPISVSLYVQQRPSWGLEWKQTGTNVKNMPLKYIVLEKKLKQTDRIKMRIPSLQLQQMKIFKFIPLEDDKIIYILQFKSTKCSSFRQCSS